MRVKGDVGDSRVGRVGRIVFVFVFGGAEGPQGVDYYDDGVVNSRLVEARTEPSEASSHVLPPHPSHPSR